MFWENYESLCIANGKSPSSVVRELGLSSSVVTKWAAGAVPRNATLKKIADYFCITVEQLAGGKIVAEDALLTTPCVDEKETPIFPDRPEGWEYLDDIDRKMVTDFIDRLLQADKYRRGEKEGGC